MKILHNIFIMKYLFNYIYFFKKKLLLYYSEHYLIEGIQIYNLFILFIEEYVIKRLKMILNLMTIFEVKSTNFQKNL